MADNGKKDPNKSKVALLGWSLRAIDAIDRFNRRYVVVAPPWAEAYAKEHDIPFVSWDFGRLNETSHEITKKLQEEGVDYAVPLYEETVEWAGAINSVLRDQPRLLARSMLFRDKSLMKRRAQLSGIRVGIFEEAHSREDVVRFLVRVNETLLKLKGDPNDPIHFKAFDQAGCLGHRVIASVSDVDQINDDEFPALLESHLDGTEFSCEVFIHDYEIQFLNISEYIHLGYSVFVPASPRLSKWRDRIRNEIEKLIKAFDIDNGLIHPEYFVTSDGEMYFGEVAYRVPGGNGFELIERAYGFNAYQGQVLCMDPKATKEELDEFFPREDQNKGYAGCFLVYPRRRVISKLEIPEETENHPYYEHHDLQPPFEQKVADRAAFGNHYGSVYFFGEDCEKLRELLIQQEELDFYV